MTSFLRNLLACCVGLVVGAHARAAEPTPTIWHGGRIVTNDGRGTVVQALLEVDGRVVALGPLKDIEARPEAKGAKKVDLKGATAVPGLQDAHGHLESYGASLEEIDLKGARSYDEVIARVRAAAAKQKEGTWILGRGWDQNLWPLQAFPHHLLLSNAVPKHPCFLVRIDGHAALVNQAALVAAKLDGLMDPQPKVQGGYVFVDEDKLASGVLLDEAMSLVSKVIPQPDTETMRRRFLNAQENLLAYGLTCVHDMGTSRRMLALLEDLRAKGALELRVVSYLEAPVEWKRDTLAGFPRKPDARDLLCVPGVKLYADGALGSRGAALLEDYSDAPGERGLLIMTEDELRKSVLSIATAGMQPAVHAIGDRANRLVLDTYERVSLVVRNFRDLRPRIEHAQVVAPKDWPRFPEMGVIASMQPTHATSDSPWVRARLGERRTKGAYAWRGLAPDLGRLAFGSDFPVESPNPLEGMYAARTRQRMGGKDDEVMLPEQCLDGLAALTGFTSGAAYACKQDDRRGRLIAGYACDLTVLDVDPTTCVPADLLKAKVLMTVINGLVVWRAP
jgi:predicted amidohydrolase YtcJ